MFQLVQFSDWSAPVAVIALMASSAVFFFFLVGALRTSRSQIDKEATRPLENETIL